MVKEVLAKRVLAAPLVAGTVCVTMHLANTNKGGREILAGTLFEDRPKLSEEELFLPAPPPPPPPQQQEKPDGKDSENSDGEDGGEDGSEGGGQGPSEEAPQSSSSQSSASASSSNMDPTVVIKYAMGAINQDSKNWIKIKGIGSSHLAISNINRLSEALKAMSASKKAEGSTSEGSAAGGGSGSGSAQE